MAEHIKLVYFSIFCLLLCNNVSSDEIMLDDFDDGPKTNDFFGNSGPWHYPNDTVTKVNYSFDNVTYRGLFGQSLKLKYNLTFSTSAGGYWWMFTYNRPDPDNPSYDLSEFDSLKFWVKGDPSEGYTTRFNIEFVDKDWNRNIVEITNVTSEWQEKEINLTQLTNVNWTKMRNLAVKLESNNLTNQKGVLYFDEVSFIDHDVNITTDDQFLDLISKRTFNYFWENADPETGFVRDKASNREVTSVAAIGFELTAIGIGESRGWITREIASNRTLKVLKNLWNGSQGNNATGCMGYKGFFYHILDISTGERNGNSELSSIDTALLMAGVLFSGEYFNDTNDVEEEIRNLSDKIYKRVNWTWMLDHDSVQFYMAWKPENETYNNVPAVGGGYFSNSKWDYYTDEIVIINLLAIGSPTHNVSPDTFYKWLRKKGNYGNYSLYKSWWGSLFTYFFASCWFDIRNKIENSEYNIDWWENSRNAVLSNREFCINESSNFKTYDQDSWGLTACFGQKGYNGGIPQSYGAPPTGDSNGAWHDGTIAPYGAGSSIVFLSDDSSENEAFAALKNYYHNFSYLWGIYGFRDAYNLGNSINSSDDWFAHDYVGIDEGSMLLMIENYRTGMVWNTFMKNEYVQSAVNSVFKSKQDTTIKTYSASLNPGWNLISIPLTPKNTSIKSVLASVEGSYTKVGAWVNGTGRHYIPGFPFNTLNEINEKMGFWIKMNQTRTLTVEGHNPTDRKIPLQTGWNLVGFLSTNKTLSLANALTSISGKYTKVGAWINGTGKHFIPGFPFNTLINMSEGYGYWIKMNTSGVLDYNYTSFDFSGLYNECYYITSASMSEANNINISHNKPGYGAVNHWRIGNYRADSVNPGTSAISMVGLLYGYNRLVLSGQSTTELDTRVKTTLRSFFWNWTANTGNQIIDDNGYVGFPNGDPIPIEYNISGDIVQKSSIANAGTTAEILMAMCKYRQLSPNNDKADYQSQMYDLALKMAQYVDGPNLSSWTSDRSYAVASFRAFANWASAVGDTTNASYYSTRADVIAGWLVYAEDNATTSQSWYNYFNYLDGGNKGVYLNADQTGFAPYEFNALDANTSFAQQVGESWDHGKYQDKYHMTEQSGIYAGGVHQTTAHHSRVYPGPSFQLASAEWKMGRVNESLWHYNCAMTPVGSTTGLGCRVIDTSFDGHLGGFIDWVDINNSSRPSNDWERFVDTSGYMIIATEELFFNNEVDWSY